MWSLKDPPVGSFRSVIHHVSVEVAELEPCGRFYDALLGSLGWRRTEETESLIGWGIVRTVFFASAGGSANPGEANGHVCFSGNSIPAVKAAWESGIAAGGSDRGAPGPRPEYGATYYSAYLLDPEGHRVEVAVRSGDSS